MTVTATPSPGSRPCSRRCSAASAMSSSPSTVAPLVEVRGADPVVDVAPVGLGADHGDGRVEAAEDLGRHLIGRAVGAVEHDVEALEVQPGEPDLQLAQVVL